MSTTMEALDPQYLDIGEEEIENYLKDHPMPDDPEYSKQDMINGLTNSSGMYTLPMNIEDETVSFIEDMLNDLI